MKLRKQLMLCLSLVVGMLLLAGCGVGEKLQPVNSSDSKDSKLVKYEGTLTIGDNLYLADMQNYTFDGFVNDSVVISVSEVRTMFIPLETTAWITLPYTSERVKFKIKNIDKVNGSIDIELHEKNEEK